VNRYYLILRLASLGSFSQSTSANLSFTIDSEDHLSKGVHMLVVYKDHFIKYGVSFGTALAIAISFVQNHSVLWAIIHGIFGWFYVAYYVLTHHNSL
jgi:hypothetical protein